MIGLLMILILLFLLTLGLLLHYHWAVRQLTQQIRSKRETGSQTRLTSPNHHSSLVGLMEQVDQLFKEVDKAGRVSRQEKKTLDMAISNIAHDIRTPLTIASGYTQQLLKKEESSQTLQKIRDNLALVSKRLESLMEYRRLMEGRIQMRASRQDLSQLTAQQLFSCYDAFQTQEIDMDLDLQEGVILETDPEIYERIVQNMLSNVLKHGREAATISLKKEGDQVSLCVRNRVLQPIQHLDKLTNRFYSENLSQSEESSGLGLYIIQQLVEILGGQLEMGTQEDWFQLTVIL